MILYPIYIEIIVYRDKTVDKSTGAFTLISKNTLEVNWYYSRFNLLDFQSVGLKKKSKFIFYLPFFLALLSQICYSYDSDTKQKEHTMKIQLARRNQDYKGRDEVPEDFDAFWDWEVKKVSTLPAYQLEERDFCIPQVKCYELTFKGTRDGLVYARVVLPKIDQKVPVIFHFHGYMGRCWDWADMLAYTVAGMVLCLWT